MSISTPNAIMYFEWTGNEIQMHIETREGLSIVGKMSAKELHQHIMVAEKTLDCYLDSEKPWTSKGKRFNSNSSRWEEKLVGIESEKYKENLKKYAWTKQDKEDIEQAIRNHPEWF